MKGAERRVETRDVRLSGRPDFFDRHTIVEYKSSLPDPSSPRATEVLDGGRRQLRLYAAILADVEKRWPATDRLVTAGGNAKKLTLDPKECKAEAEGALETLAEVDKVLCRGTEPETLAT